MLRSLKAFTKFNKVFFRFFISVGLFLIVLYSIDLTATLQSVQMIKWEYLPLILFLIFLSYFLSSFRWKMLLIFENTSHVSYKYLTALYFMGAYFNNFMPTAIGGDLFKAYRLGQKINNKTNAAVATILERFSTFLVLVIFSYFGLIFTRDIWQELLPQFVLMRPFLTFLVDFVVFTGFWWFCVLSFIVLYFLAHKISRFARIYAALRLYFFNRKVLALTFLISLVVHTLTVLSQLLIFQALGVNIPLIYAFAIFPLITLVMSLTPSLNGIGVQDVMYIELLKVVAVSAPLAFSASLIYHGCRLAVSLIGGLLYAFESEK